MSKIQEASMIKNEVAEMGAGIEDAPAAVEEGK